jgi:hypothetical protein
MNIDNPLLVPMTVEALVVNDLFRTGGTFIRNQMAYGNLAAAGNADPGLAFNDNNFILPGQQALPNGILAGDFYNGVYLKWRLPENFTRGIMDDGTGEIDYPLVPNRWLIVRYSGPPTQRVATAWIVESDFQYPNNQVPAPLNVSGIASNYLLAQGNAPLPASIGRNVLLGSWSEQGFDVGLQAIAPGNPSFAFFQPQCNNVFSFVDCLNQAPPESLSYMVTGWFSDGTNDPLDTKLAVVNVKEPENVVNTLQFAASSATAASWAAGTITINETVYNIQAGSTGDMYMETYLYLNPATSTTTLQLTTSHDDAHAMGCFCVAKAMPFFTAAMASLGWTTLPGTDSTLTASWCMLYGCANDVSWQNTSLPPGGAPTTQNGNPPVAVAVGNTSVEALTAMITGQAAVQNITVDSELLEAFQLDMVEVFDQPDGAARLADELHNSFFQKSAGQYIWNIVDAPDNTTEVSPQELEKEQQWLVALNQNQQTLDAAVLRLASLQAQLYVMWWKFTSWPSAFQGSTTIAGLGDDSLLQNAIDPSQQGSLAQQTLQQLNLVATLTATVPTGDTPEALEQAILAYAAKQDLPNTRQLKRSTSSDYFVPNNPVVLIAGPGASGVVKPAKDIVCRFPTQLVNGYDVGSTPVSANTMSIPPAPVMQASGVPWSVAFMTSLIAEFFLIDPANATMISNAYSLSEADVQNAITALPTTQPNYPVGAIAAWSSNPWHPLRMCWAVDYYPIDFGTKDSPNWSFANGQYFWTGAPASVGNKLTFAGSIQLALTANFNMKSRLESFLKHNSELNTLERSEFEALLNFVNTNSDWDLLSQVLDGFNNQLQLAQPGVFLGPLSSTFVSTPPTASLVGSTDTYPPMIGKIPTAEPYTSTFLPLRSGQFVFDTLVLIDEWGQSLQADTNVYTPADLTPVITSPQVSLMIASTVAIASIEPSVATFGTSVTVTVTGANFVTGVTAMVGQDAMTTTVVNSTTLTFLLDSTKTTQSGPLQISVYNGGIWSNAVYFHVAMVGWPVIDSISPNLIQAGTVSSATFDLMVSGVGFENSATVQWNAKSVPTQFVSSTSLLATIPAGAAFALGIALVTVLSGGNSSSCVPFTIVPSCAIGALSPPIIPTVSSALTLTVTGVGFQPNSVIEFNNTSLPTTFISTTQLSASVPPQQCSQYYFVNVAVSMGTTVSPNNQSPFIQLSPALLQPAQLRFNLVSAQNDNCPFGPLNIDVDPICGWILPNHLDKSLMTYDAAGLALGELSIGITSSDSQSVIWANAPLSPYTSLNDIAKAIPHFGSFLETLSNQTPDTFTAFLTAIDETLWTTAPMGAAFDRDLSLLIGRPLAMVRASLELLLAGAPIADPSWQFTFASTGPATDLTAYQFPIELGNISRLSDGLIGYFENDDYSVFNVLAQSQSTQGSYLNTIGVDNNYVFCSFNGPPAFVSMLVDPYAAVHASTDLLPMCSVRLPLPFTTSALAAMDVTFRIDGMLTEQLQPTTGPSTILMPVPSEKTGSWQWMENDAGTWTTYATATNTTNAQLSDLLPVLRRGLLQLNAPNKASR